MVPNQKTKQKNKEKTTKKKKDLVTRTKKFAQTSQEGHSNTEHKIEIKTLKTERFKSTVSASGSISWADQALTLIKT